MVQSGGRKQRNGKRKSVEELPPTDSRHSRNKTAEEVNHISAGLSRLFAQQGEKLVESRDAADDLHHFVVVNTLAQITKESLTLVLDKLDNSFELVTVGQSIDGFSNSWFW